MSAYRVRIVKTGTTLDRTITIEAPHSAAARAIGEGQCEAGETIPAGEKYVVLDAYAHIDVNPVMPPDHARNVAMGGRPREERHA
jgi:hypothetical protein